MKPLALVRTVVPPIVVVFRAVPVLLAVVPAPAALPTATPSSTSAATARIAVDQLRPSGRSPAGSGRGIRGAGRPSAARPRPRARCGTGASASAARTANAATSTHAGDDAGGRADLLEPEQPDPDRQQVAAERGQREACTRGGRQPAGDHEPARDDEHRQPQGEGGDHLQQEQPADRRDRPVAGHVQVEMDRCGGDQQTRPRYAQDDSAASRRPAVLRARARLARSPLSFPA